MEKKEKTIIDVMEERGYDIVKVNEENVPSFIFQKVKEGPGNDDILIEVFSGKKYHFVYTNINFLGWLESGMLEDIFNEEKFNERLEYFLKGVEKLKEGFEYE